MPKHVLCADDSVTMQKVVAITFANSEFQVLQARSADEALALAKTHRPDLVLADAAMPGRSGYDLCQALKSDPTTRNVPVIILCGNSSPYDDVRGRSVGADSFLVKPWDTTTFLEKLGEIVSRAATQGAVQPTGRAASFPPVGGPAPVAGPHVVSRPSSIPPVAKPPTQPQAAAQNPTMMGMPRPVPPAPAPAAARPIPAPPAGLPKPPPGLPRPPLIRGAMTASGVRPSAAMPRVSSAQPASPPVVAPSAPRPPPPAAAPQPAPVVAPPAAPTPPPVAPSSHLTGPLPPAVRPAPPRPPAARSATIMGMPAVSTPPAAPTHLPGPPPAAPSHPPPVTPIVPRAELTPPPVLVAPKPAPVTISPPVVAPKAMPTPAPAPPVTRVAPQPAAAPAAAPADGRGPEYEAVIKLSREIIERIAWEVVPELAEALLRENLHKLQK